MLLYFTAFNATIITKQMIFMEYKMSYQHLLVPIDGSEISISALKQAASLAKKTEAKLTAMCLIAVDPFDSADFYSVSPMLKDYFVAAYEKAETTLAQAQQLCATDYGLDIETVIVKGEISAEHIVTVAENSDVDLVVMGSHGRKGFQRFFLGSLANEVLANTELPVLIIKK